jgi:hypothetical protein
MSFTRRTPDGVLRTSAALVIKALISELHNTAGMKGPQLNVRAIVPHHLILLDCPRDRVYQEETVPRSPRLNDRDGLSSVFKLRNNRLNYCLSISSLLTLAIEANHQRSRGSQGY